MTDITAERGICPSSCVSEYKLSWGVLAWLRWLLRGKIDGENKISFVGRDNLCGYQ